MDRAQGEPSPEEIRDRAAAIREGWTATEYAKRDCYAAWRFPAQVPGAESAGTPAVDESIDEGSIVW